MDVLSYAYINGGNRLQRVNDTGNGTYGFVNGASLTTEYTYDGNGNMKTDTNKGVTGIDYNHLNLPKSVILGGGTISYIYDATGVKQRKVAGTTTTDYAGNYMYKNNVLQFFNHPEDYVENNSGSLKYHYQYKDQLGNVRLSYSDLDGNGSINASSEILDEKNYYPFGGEHAGYNTAVKGTYHPYGFNGKEEQDELGLQWMDFGARNYDKWLGRWMNVDPLAEIFLEYSPFSSMMNNPIMFIDPDGRAAMSPIYNTNGDFLGTDDQGLQGEAIVMNEENFTQGMSHDEALQSNLGAQGLTGGAAGRNLISHFVSLSSRPDYDGVVTIDEGVQWAKDHPNTKNSSDPNDVLYLDASKMDFGSLKSSDMAMGVKANYNLFNYVNYASNNSRFTTYALGNTQMKLLNSSGSVQLYSDVYDWDYHQKGYSHSIKNPPNSTRDKLVWGDRILKGLNDSHGFKVSIYGTGTLNTSKPYTPVFPRGPKL